ncbi:MAG: ChaN family lipoprotein [Candidatus Cloacimonetes bacterium]|nr:ChaN family lipoprotein [Candidatus Cloacimonadota bacterium]
MIKKRLILGLLMILLVIFNIVSCSKQSEDYTIYDTTTGRKISLSRMAEQLSNYDIVMFGEYHGNAMIHQLQAELLPYYLRYAENIAISMEMFERDDQELLDYFLEGNIDEEEFLSNARAWPNYKSDYKPIVDFAQENQIYVIASNVPRMYAAAISRFGTDSLDMIPEDEKVYLARELVILEDDYKDKFYETILDTPHLDLIDPNTLEQRLINLYAAQSLKDDTMAESIIEFMNNVPDTKVIHFNGDFHSRYRLGVVTKLNRLNPDLRIAVISPYQVGSDEKFSYKREMSNISNFLIVIHDQDDKN